MSVDPAPLRDRLRDRARPALRFGDGIGANERADRHLSIITGLLLLVILIGPPLAATGIISRHLIDAIGALVIVSGVVVGFGELRITRIIIVLAIVLAALRVANVWLPDENLRFADAVFAIASTGLLGWFMLARLLRRRGRVNGHRVAGAVGVYLVLGLLFAQIYRMVAMFQPRAFLVQGAPVGYDAIVPQLLYFSFVVLTSLGFGDITPEHPIARTVVNFEALIGVLFPAILISRLVSLEVNREEEH